MFDLTRSKFNDKNEWPIIAGTTIVEEGGLWVFASDSAGGVGVQPCSAAAGQRYAGFGISDAMRVSTETVVETITVPNPLGTVTLSHTNIVAASEYAVGSTTGAMTQGTNYDLTDSTGVIDFATYTAVAGETVTIQYRYNLTLVDILNKYHERSINNRAQDYFSTISLGCLQGHIFTSMYDTSVAYTINGLVYPAASGKISSTDPGSTTAIGYVIQTPGVNDSLLGVQFSF